MSADEHEARAAAYTSCADHLELEWTDDATERNQGNILQLRLRNRANYHLEIADQLRTAAIRK